MKFAICNEMFEDWNIEDVFQYAAEVGYDGVEVAPFTIADRVGEVDAARRDAIRRAASDAGVGVVGTHWLLVSPPGMYLTHPDAEIRDRTRAYFVELIDFTADIGGSRMILGSPKQRDVMDGVTYEEAWSYARELFRDIAPTAEERDVVLCIEPLAPVETNFIQTAEDAISMAREVDSPNVKIILDAKAMSSEEKEIPQIIRDSAGWVGHVHANDPNLRGPGFGDLAYEPIADALRDIGYADWVSVEVFDFEVDPKLTATRSIEYLRASFGVQAG